MVNASGTNNQLIPNGAEPQSAGCPPDSKLPENSKENLDARLDHAIEETFPTSDPVSVTITKGAGIDPHGREASPASGSDQKTGAGQDSTEGLLDQVREALSDVAEGASKVAGTAYSHGERYARRIDEQYPEARRYAGEARRVVNRYTSESQILSLIVAGAIGYALAWMVHSERRNRGRDVPDYGRTDRAYSAHGGTRRR